MSDTELYLLIIALIIALISLLFGQGLIRDWLKKRKAQGYKMEIQKFGPTKEKIGYKILEYIDKNRTVMEDEIFYPNSLFDKLKEEEIMLEKEEIVEVIKDMWDYGYIENISEHEIPYYRITKKGRQFLDRYKMPISESRAESQTIRILESIAYKFNNVDKDVTLKQIFSIIGEAITFQCRKYDIEIKLIEHISPNIREAKMQALTDNDFFQKLYDFDMAEALKKLSAMELIEITERTSPSIWEGAPPVTTEYFKITSLGKKVLKYINYGL